MKQSQRVVKNVLAGGVSVAIGGLIQLAAITLIARSVSVAEFGTYSFILAFGIFIWLLADSGLSTILVRELATQPAEMPKILGGALTLIWILSIGGELLILAVIPFLHLGLTEKILTAVMGLATLTQFHCAGYSAALRAREDNEIQALGFLLHKILFFIFIFIGLKSGLALIGVVVSHLIPNLFLWAFYRRMVVRRYGAPHLQWDVGRWKYLLTHSLPVGGSAMLRLAAEQADVLIIKLLSDDRTVGLFSGPYRISMALRLIPQTLSGPLYPMYSRLAQEAGPRTALHEAYQRSVKFFLLIACPIAAVFIVSSGKLLTTVLKPEYAVAIPAMQLLGLAFVPFFLSSSLPLLLTALHEQRFLLKSSAFSLALRVLLNFALVPIYGFLGPCLAFLLSETTVVTIWIHKLHRMGFPLEIWAIFWRLVLATTGMAAVLYPVKDSSMLILLPVALVSVVVYALAAWQLGILSTADLALAKEGAGFLKPFLSQRTPPSAPPE
jgi:O-antigen/teichoic acid export membrane protein